MLKKLLFSVGLSLIGSSFLYAQFAASGDATETSCNCYNLTDDVDNQAGSVRAIATQNLAFPFNLKFTVNFGCEDTGGEGLAFVMQTGGWTIGSGGFGLGYQSIVGDVLAIEFDTRDNEASGELDNWDIPGDHISLQDNGDIFHEAANPNNLLGTPTGLNATEDPTPHNIKPGFSNLEDCEDHIVEINWTPGVNQTLQVKVDNITSLTYIGDMISDQFGGSSNVTWGWTGSTSTFSNTQTVCTALVPAFTFSPTNCPGETIDFTDNSCSYFPITDWDWDFATLETSTLQNPSYSFADAGDYNVEFSITDNQGCTKSTNVSIPVGFNTEVTADNLSVCPDGSTTLRAEGSPFIASECCFKLVLNDLWGDYWGSGTPNEIEIFADGDLFGAYTPTSFDPGSGTSDTIDLCFDQDTELEFVINGIDSPGECSYFFLDEDLNVIISVDGAVAGTWTDGASETHEVDCGLTVPDFEYLWDNAPLLSDITVADPVATVSTDTWFYVDITNPATGCTITDSILITTEPPVTAVLSGTDEICEGTDGNLTVTFTGSAPYDITINGPSGPLPTITGIMTSPYTLNVSEDGTYTITAVTGNGCDGTFSGSGEINVIVPFDVNIEASAIYCEGDPIADLSVVSTGGGTVNWYDNASLTPPILATGNTFTPPSVVGTQTYYAAETEGTLGCTGAPDNVTITINPIPTAPTFTGETSYCEDDVATTLFGEASAGGAIKWYDAPPPTGTELATGTSYTPTLIAPGLTIYITEIAFGCEGPATAIDITVNPTPVAPVVAGTTDYCDGDVPTELTATISGGGVIEWRSSTGDLLSSGTTYTPVLSVVAPTLNVYEVLGGCTSEATVITINVQPAPSVELPEDVEICIGDSIQVTATHNGYDISWDDSQIGETVWLKPIITTTYIATATSVACGDDTDDIVILVNPLPEVTASADTVIGIGGEIELSATSSSTSNFTWSPEVLECLIEDCSIIYDVPDQATVYIVSATDEKGCTSSDTVFVDINGVMEVFVPNIFSPNGDGSNDVLVIEGPRLFNFSLEIYDRWGKRVFLSKDQDNEWNGTFNEKTLGPQTFVYILKGNTVLGDSIEKEGNVTIIK